MNYEKNIYDLVTAKKFLRDIRDYSIIDSDGSIADIYVDGYLSNLCLHENGFSQGKFLISGEVLENLCEKHNIVVNWANK